MPIVVEGNKFVETTLLDYRKILNDIQIQIIELLKNGEMYPLEIAEKLKLNEQNVYYHIRILEKMGFIKVSRTEKVRNIRKYYSLSSDAFSIIIRKNFKKFNRSFDDRYLTFFSNFITNGEFNGSIVVGAPFEHGPYLTSSKDGHYAVQLSFFLGSFISLPKRFVIKLDTEVKAEDAFKRNLILIGGPITNVLTYEINKKLPAKFDWKTQWKLITKKKVYSGDFDGVVEKIQNPWSKDHEIILFAGLHAEGTKAVILGVTQHPEILEDFGTYKILRGIDKDGDGKVDDIKIMEEG